MKFLFQRPFYLLLWIAAVSGGVARANASSPTVVTVAEPGTFQLLADERPADICVDPNDHRIAQIAAGLLADDVERVTGRKPGVKTQAGAAGLSSHAVFIGTIGQSQLIDALVAAGKLDVSDVKGQWESFVIQTIDNPAQGVERALIIAGSDRRGTAYGVFEVAEQIGVSPWHFWADVQPDKKDALFIKPGRHVTKSPDVKYRGIFINDEDWGLQPWAAKTFDPAFGDIGPKTYEKVFELILRLRGNHLWPAMHGCTIEFGSVPGNAKLADDWAIVMGAAHCEPLNRNNVWWKKDGVGEWRYDTNRLNMINYWEEWAQKRGDYEAVWTVGMRGIHDSGMPGPKDVDGQIKLLEKAIDDQRDLLKEHVDPKIEQVPQVFTPYKEALTHYQQGLKLPDDVTILWCEDNYGYIRQLSNPEEQKRAGGSGVYYHVSYLGWPRPYLWLDTTPPALMWSEMSKAYDHGADRVWVLNVGDIKSCERGTEFWFDLAWDVDSFDENAQMTFLRQWVERDFGEKHAEEIAAVMNDYYQLNFQRKPELMADDVFSLVEDREAERRLEAFEDIRARAEAIYEKLPEHKRDGYYQLVLYPVRMSAATNAAFINADFSRLYARQGRFEADEFARRSQEAVTTVETETAYFNNTLAGGKWKHIMTAKGIGGNWNLKWPAVGSVKPTGTPHLSVAVEGQGVPLLSDEVMASLQGNVIDIAARDGTFDSAFKLQREKDVEGLVVPNAEPGASRGNTLEPGKGPKATFTFEVPRDGKYNLFAHVYCPTNNDDSWFIKLDDSQWMGWNDVGTGQSWQWKQQGTYDLKAGPHTLTISNREDGAILSKIRFTDGPAPESLEELYPEAQPDVLPAFNRFTGNKRYVDVYNTSDQPIAWNAEPSASWIRVAPASGNLGLQERVWIEIDWAKLPAASDRNGTVTFTGGEDRHVVKVSVDDVVSPGASEPAVFVENDAAVAIEAEHFTRNIPGETSTAQWSAVPGLGRIGGAIGVLDTTTPSDTNLAGNPSVEYDFTLLAPGEAVSISTFCLPTQRTHEGRSLRYAIAVDDEKPRVIDFHEDGGHGGEQSPRWRDNVSRNAAVNVTSHQKLPAGNHTLRVWAVDPGVIIDRFVISNDGGDTSELGPRETRREAE